MQDTFTTAKTKLGRTKPSTGPWVGHSWPRPIVLNTRMPSWRNECNKVNFGQYVKTIGVTTHNLLCLVEYYHLIGHADILVNN